MTVKSTPGSLVLVGAGGFAREVASWAGSLDPWQIVGVVSPEEPDSRLLTRAGAPWLGDDDRFLADPAAMHFCLAIGAGTVRRVLSARYSRAGLEPATLVHPTASLGPDVTLGAGTVVCAQASMSVDIAVGSHVHLDRAVTVGHDVVIGDFATVHPGAVVSGAVAIGEGAEIGANSCILQGRMIGAGARVGAGAVVTRDVAPGETVAGIPARERGQGR